MEIRRKHQITQFKFISLAILYGSALTAEAQVVCTNIMSTDIQLSGRACLLGNCLDATDFSNVKMMQQNNISSTDLQNVKILKQSNTTADDLQVLKTIKQNNITTEDLKMLKALKESQLNSTDLGTLKQFSGPLLPSIDPTGTAVSLALQNPSREFPPSGIPTGGHWTKDTSVYFPGLSGWFPNYRTDINAISTYLPGRYIAWANTVNGYLNSTSFGGDEWPPSGAFDKQKGISYGRNGYHVADYGTTARELILTLPRPILIRSYSIESRNDGGTVQNPTSFTVSGSTDGKDWSIIDRRSSVTGWVLGESLVFTVSKPMKALYQYLKLSSLNLVSIGEMRYFGSLEIDVLNHFNLLTDTIVNTADLSWSREIAGQRTYFECAEICSRDVSCRLFMSNGACTLFDQDPVTIPRSTQSGSVCGIKK